MQIQIKTGWIIDCTHTDQGLQGCVRHTLEVEMIDRGQLKANVLEFGSGVPKGLSGPLLSHCVGKKPRSINIGLRILPAPWWIPGRFHCWAPDTKNIPAFDKRERTWPAGWCVCMVWHNGCTLTGNLLTSFSETLKYVDYNSYDS